MRGGAGRLPSFLTSFIGREEEQLRLSRLLQDSRLVTITGPGGSGKTRLAVEVAQQRSDEEGIDAWFVDLTLAGAEEAVVTIAAAAVGVGQEASLASMHAVAGFIGRERALLLFDNCEHIIGGAASLISSLLQQCPLLDVLATSRQRLSIPGERVLRLGPLSTADQAVALFTDRARLVSTTFAATPAEMCDACERLDRIPLAIELAASTVDTLPISELSANLERSCLAPFSARGVPARQQTLRSTIEWSYELLDADQKALFSRLAIFPEGWTSEAAARVCYDGELNNDLAELLSTLAERCLVTFDQTEQRYRMLPTIREFAHSKLPEPSIYRSRLATWCHEFLEREEPRLRSRNRTQATAVIGKEHTNILGALAACMNEAEGGLGLRIAVLAASYWHCLGLTNETIRWLGFFGTRCPQSELVPVAEAHLARALYKAGEAREGRPVLERLLARADSCEAGVWLHSVPLIVPELPLASRRKVVDKGLALSVNAGDLWFAAFLQLEAAFLAIEESDWPRHETYLRSAQMLVEEIGDPWLALMAQEAAADGLNRRGEYELGRRVLEQAVRLAGPWPERQADFYESLFRIMVRQRDHEGLEKIVRTCLGLHRRLRAGSVLMCLGYFAAIPYRRGDVSFAMELLALVKHQTETRFIDMAEADREALERSERRFRAELDDATFQQAVARGRSLSVPQAVDLALSYPATNLAPPTRPSTALPAGLSRREVEVVKLIAHGYRNREIAEMLVVSVRTVEAHVLNAYDKIGVRGRAAVSAWAVKNGLTADE